MLTAGPTPRVPTDQWEFTVTTESGQRHVWSWQKLLALPADTITVDLHCVTKWSKLGTEWQGVSLDTLLADVLTAADYALVHSYGGYTTKLPLEDLLDGQPPARTACRRAADRRRWLLGAAQLLDRFGGRWQPDRVERAAGTWRRGVAVSVDVLAVGAPVELRGPVGGWFVWHAADPAPVLLVAGGSGIAPLMAMVRDRAAQGSGVPFRLVYSVRTHRTCTSPTSCADAAATTAA